VIEFAYTAKDRKNDKIVKGKISADNEMAAAEILNSKSLYPIKIVSASSQNILGNINFFNRVSAKNRVIFTRQLATLVKAGLPITQALNTAIEQVNDKNFKAILEKIAASVEGGTSLAESFSQYPTVFNPVYVSLVHAGEESGTLDQTLLRLADQQEKEQQIVSKIRGALIYPALVLVTIIAVLGFMLVSVMPQIQGLYDELKKPLPIITRITLLISQFSIRYWWLTIILIVAIIFGIRAYIRSPNGRRAWDRFKMRTPVFGTLFRKMYMARFARTLGSLVNSGVPLLEALNISADAMNNVILQAVVLKAAEDVKTGKSLSSALSKNEYFIKLVPQMIKVGEESGTLGDMLDKVASFYEDEVDQAVKNISTIIEPVLMIILGFMVFFIIIAVLYPIYSLVGGGLDVAPGSSNSSGTNTTQTQ
jgi:type IV pilus assembly protein PilC